MLCFCLLSRSWIGANLHLPLLSYFESLFPFAISHIPNYVICGMWSHHTHTYRFVYNFESAVYMYM
jgi:ABC-type multidrug transport system permease subunit